MSFLPLNQADMKARGWDYLDFIFVSGDAYVDHPSFGPSLLTRLLESHGYKVGLICQPDWKKIESFQVLGRPRLAFLVSGGNMDSMVLHYTSTKKERKEDYYTPGKVMGKRPDRATIVYCAALRQAYKQVNIIIGGIETSLRRLSHYDYWTGKVRRSVLLDSKADIGVYGMGETALLEIATRLKKGESVDTIRDVRGTIFRTSSLEGLPHPRILPTFEEVSENKKAYATSFQVQYVNTDPHSALPLAEKAGHDFVYQNPPSWPLEREFMDRLYTLPFERNAHPSYQSQGGIAALEEVKFGLISTRGCFGACSFCALSFHQGRIIQSRSHESLIEEAKGIIKDPGFKGYIHDVGGPTANFRQNPCAKMGKKGACMDKRCLSPSVCSNLKADHTDFLSLLRKLRVLPGIKKVFIRSGIRFDYLMEDSNSAFFKELVEHHVSGQLKVAPEHVSSKVLSAMGKPNHKIYEGFKEKFFKFNETCGKNQFLVPYFISSHPGSTLEDAVELAVYLRETGYIPEQVQDFYPTPGTLSTAMYFSEIDPLTKKSIYVAKTSKDKALQRALLQFHLPQNYELVKEALNLTGRTDLIGTGPHCLIPLYQDQRMKKPLGSRNYLKPAMVRPREEKPLVDHGDRHQSDRGQARDRTGTERGQTPIRPGTERGQTRDRPRSDPNPSRGEPRKFPGKDKPSLGKKNEVARSPNPRGKSLIPDGKPRPKNQSKHTPWEKMPKASDKRRN